MKKSIFLFLVTVMFTVIFVQSGRAQTSTAPSGTGTSGDPYLIATLNNLYWLSQTTAAWASGKYCKQTANIDASSTSTWASGAGFSPIGRSPNYYYGNYNGQGYSIDGLTMNRTTYDDATGMFAYVAGGLIQYVYLTNVNIKGGGNSGALVAYLMGGTVQYCYSSGYVEGMYDTGGLIGCSDGTGPLIQESWSSANVYGTNTVNSIVYIGGFIGQIRSTVKNCYATGNITIASGQSYRGAGGFAGFCVNHGGPAIITNCYASGTITGNGTKNGLVGAIDASYPGTYTDCFYDATKLPSGGPGTGKTTAQMKTQATFPAGWNFTSVWDINALYNSGYPILRAITYQPDPNTWTGAISTDWNTLGNWSFGSFPTSSDNITIPNVTNKPVISNGNTGSAKNITINSGSSLTINGTINIAGSVANSGTFTTSSGAVNFTGSSAQTTTGLSGSFGSMTINNLSGVTLSGATTISGTLTLTSGLLNLGAYNLTLGSSATISGTPSASNMIVATGAGQVIKTFTGIGSFVYPVGDNTGTAEYSPITLNFTSGSFSSATAGVLLSNTKFSSNTSSSHYLNRYWTVTQSGISSFSCDVTAQYLPADVVGTESNIYAGKYSGSWILLNQADVANHRLTGTVTGFSTFTGGENGVLPVTLSLFTSSVNVRDVKLNWVTGSEMNNSGFNIERAGIRQQATGNWEKIGFVTGKGTTNTTTNYTFEDKKLATGKYQYRLKQIDNNGNFEYHELAGEVEVGVPTKYELSQNYPNPFNPMTKIDFQLPMDGKVSLKIFDITGREIATLVNNEFKKADYYTVMFNGSNLSSGVYFYRIVADKYVMTKKMVLVK
jgi:hypothetical protein